MYESTTSTSDLPHHTFSENKSFPTFFRYTSSPPFLISAVQLQTLPRCFFRLSIPRSIYKFIPSTIMSASEPIADKSDLAMNGLLELGLGGSSLQAATFNLAL